MRMYSGDDMNPPRSFLWHDYETFGTHPALDRPAQFAALRTDSDLNVTGEPLEWYCAPANDFLPHPSACLITGITPQEAGRRGGCEAGFARRINDEMMEPGTCAVGYNSLRFDDEFSRNIFYRNFFDAYAREWQNGNSRWDLIDLCRMCYALRPGGIEWPMREPGVPSFRLEHLTEANNISHEGAHDALADVRATLALARLLRAKQPRLFNWALGLRDQKTVMSRLDPIDPKPFLHSSMRIPAARGCTSLFLPLAIHPRFKKSVIVFDLMADPAPLLQEDAGHIHDLVFTPRADLPEGLERLPLKAIKTNGVPMVAPAATLNNVDCGRIGLDPGRCRGHAQLLSSALENVRYKVMEVFSQSPAFEAGDPDMMIYSGGFFPPADKRLMDKVRTSSPEQLALGVWRFKDPRLPEMLFRYRARNYPESLSPAELARWNEYRRRRLLHPEHDRQLGYEEFLAALARAREEHSGDGRAQGILDQLESWSLELNLETENTGRAEDC
jgi:exodeoxyribonuclease-1